MSICPQSRQSTRLFLQSSKLGPPPPLHPQASVPPLLLVPGGTHLLAEKGVGGGSQFGQGEKSCGTLDLMYFVPVPAPLPFKTQVSCLAMDAQISVLGIHTVHVISLLLTNTVQYRRCGAGLPNHMMGEVSWDPKRRRSCFFF